MKQLICNNPVGFMSLAWLAGFAACIVTLLVKTGIREASKIKAHLRHGADYPEELGI